MAGILYLVATPIGNLSDISPRALKVLGDADFIAAEDSRVTIKLLNHYNIKKPIVSYYEHNKYSSGERIVERILGGESCALVSDAGMPIVSDPGEDLVETCYENGIKVLVIPGACAAVSALAVSGLSSGRFVFEGFLSVSKKQRNLRLNELSREERTIIFYEAPHKLIATLEDFLTYFGDRRISISRELTKIHEETVLTTVSLALEHYRQTKPRGEFVLVLEGASRQDSPEISEDEAVQILQNYREKGYSLKESARLAAADSGYKKNRLYDMALSCDENA